MTFDPTTNRAPFYRLTVSQRTTLKEAKHGWERLERGNWKSVLNPRWLGSSIYRAKPAPVVKSVWANVYFEADDFENYWIYVSPARFDRKTANCCATSHKANRRRNSLQSNRIGVVRFDLIDGVLSVELEPLDGDQEGADESIGPAYSLCEPFPSAPIKVRFDTDGHEQEGQQ